MTRKNRVKIRKSTKRTGRKNTRKYRGGYIWDSEITQLIKQRNNVCKGRFWGDNENCTPDNKLKDIDENIYLILSREGYNPNKLKKYTQQQQQYIDDKLTKYANELLVSFTNKKSQNTKLCNIVKKILKLPASKTSEQTSEQTSKQTSKQTSEQTSKPMAASTNDQQNNISESNITSEVNKKPKPYFSNFYNFFNFFKRKTNENTKINQLTS